ncbi:hypothetical protein SMALA_6102 [Streptomyces malaysiensis subsp. malaysiensis]|nr:hypothetical protein SMALA_6102 [Streptomyces malaysiensis]
MPTNSLSCHLRCTHEQADRPQGGRRVAPWALAPRPGRAPSFRRDDGTPDGEARRCRTARMGGRPQPKPPREVNPNQRRRGGPRALALGPGWAPLFFRRDGGSLNGAVRRCRTARIGGRPQPKTRVTGPGRRARTGGSARWPPKCWLWGPAGPLLPAATAGRPTARPGGAEPPA